MDAQRQKQRAMTIGSATTRGPAKWRTLRRHDVVSHALAPRARVTLAAPMAPQLPQVATYQPQTPASDQQNSVWGSARRCSTLQPAHLAVIELWRTHCGI